MATYILHNIYIKIIIAIILLKLSKLKIRLIKNLEKVILFEIQINYQKFKISQYIFYRIYY